MDGWSNQIDTTLQDIANAKMISFIQISPWISLNVKEKQETETMHGGEDKSNVIFQDRS